MTKKTFEFDEVIRLKPGEKAVIEGMTLQNEGYDHRNTEKKGERPFVGLKIQHLGEASSINFYTSDLPKYQQWNDWLITLKKCEDLGPMHNHDAACEWIVTEKKFCSGSL